MVGFDVGTVGAIVVGADVVGEGVTTTTVHEEAPPQEGAF